MAGIFFFSKEFCLKRLPLCILSSFPNTHPNFPKERAQGPIRNGGAVLESLVRSVEVRELSQAAVVLSSHAVCPPHTCARTGWKRVQELEFLAVVVSDPMRVPGRLSNPETSLCFQGSMFCIC